MNMPKTIGKYQLESLLGEGGMGQVYKAFDPRVRRYLAIKILRTERLEGTQKEREFKERFFREGQICGSLNHPNIVTIYEMDETPGGLFIAMEFIEGKALSEFIENPATMSSKKKLQLLKQVAGALDYAHMVGVVHRDLKPSNIILSDSGQAKITDFGIAKLIEDHQTRLTLTGMFVGTPRYASPEQICGQEITALADVFSFGVLTYEILTGASPFGGASISEILYKITAGEVNFLPIENTLEMTHPRIRQVFQRVLHAEPEKRYPKAGDFLAALETTLQLDNAHAKLNKTMETMRIPRMDVSRSQVPLPPDPEAQYATHQMGDHYAQKIAESSPADWDNDTESETGKTPFLPPSQSYGNASVPPAQQTMKMPRSFIQNASNTVSPYQSQPPSTPNHGVSSMAAQSGHTVKRSYPPVSKPTPSKPTPKYHHVNHEEPKSAPWWILGVLAIAAAMAGITWIAWPELKTLFQSEPATLASNLQEVAPQSNTQEDILSEDLEIPEPAEASDSETPPNETEDLTQEPPSPLAEEPAEAVLNSPEEEAKSPNPNLRSEQDQHQAEPPQPTTVPKDNPEPPRLERKPPAPKPNIVEPFVTERVKPVFPEDGLQAGIEGEVVLQAELRFDGQVDNISVLKTLEGGKYGFEDAAIKALLEYKFIPGRINGEVATIRKKFRFDFQLPHRKRVDGRRFAELVDETQLKTDPPVAPEKIAPLQQPVFHSRVQPVYPPAGLEAGLTGKVVLRVHLLKDGTMGQIEVVEGLGNGQYGFEQAAIDAVKQWQFHPGKINGAPVDMPMKVSLQFALKKAERN